MRALKPGSWGGVSSSWGRQSPLIGIPRAHEPRAWAGRSRGRRARARGHGRPRAAGDALACAGSSRRPPAAVPPRPTRGRPQTACLRAGRRAREVCGAGGGRGSRRSARGRARPASRARGSSARRKAPPRRPRRAPPRPARRTGVGDIARRPTTTRRPPPWSARAAPRAAAEEEEPDQRRREHRGEARVRIGYSAHAEEGDARAEGGQRALRREAGRRGGGGAGAQGGALERTAAARGASRGDKRPARRGRPPLEGHSQTANTTQTAHNQTHVPRGLARSSMSMPSSSRACARMSSASVSSCATSRASLEGRELRAGGGGCVRVFWGSAPPPPRRGGARAAGRPAIPHGNVTPPPPRSHACDPPLTFFPPSLPPPPASPTCRSTSSSNSCARAWGPSAPAAPSQCPPALGEGGAFSVWPLATKGESHTHSHRVPQQQASAHSSSKPFWLQLAGLYAHTPHTEAHKNTKTQARGRAPPLVLLARHADVLAARHGQRAAHRPAPPASCIARRGLVEDARGVCGGGGGRRVHAPQLHLPCRVGAVGGGAGGATGARPARAAQHAARSAARSARQPRAVVGAADAHHEGGH